LTKEQQTLIEKIMRLTNKEKRVLSFLVEIIDDAFDESKLLGR